MASANKFKGTGVAIVTPFTRKGDVDYAGLGSLVEHLVKGKVEYLVVLGTTGESATLSKEEKKEVVKFVVNKARKRVPVVIGIGGNNTQEILEAFEHTDFTGISAILSVSPYYNKPSQEGIYQHYKKIAQHAPLPVILYNVPGRTASNITADTTLRLARDFKNIIGIKEASGNLEQCMKIIKHRPAGFLVISGDDNLTLPLMACGADGVISVVANALPKDFSEMVRLAAKSKMAAAQKLHYRIFEITEQLFADGNPGGIKHALELLKVCGSDVRLPLVKPNEKVQKRLKELLASYH